VQAEISKLETDMRDAHAKVRDVLPVPCSTFALSASMGSHMSCMQTKEADGSPAAGLSGKSRAELVAETESLHQTNKMLTDQICSLQVGQGLTLLLSVSSCLHSIWL